MAGFAGSIVMLPILALILFLIATIQVNFIVIRKTQMGDSRSAFIQGVDHLIPFHIKESYFGKAYVGLKLFLIP